MIPRLVVLSLVAALVVSAEGAHAARAWRDAVVLPGSDPGLASVVVGADGLVSVLHTDHAGPEAPELYASVAPPGTQPVPALLHPDAYDVDAATDAAGNVLVVFQTYEGEVRVARKPAQAAVFSPSVVVAQRTLAFGNQQQRPHVAMNARGDAVVSWVYQSLPRWVGRAAAAFAPPGGEFGEPVFVGPELPLQPFYDRGLAIDAEGMATLAWVADRSKFDGEIQAATGTAAGGFGEPVQLSPEERTARHVRVAAAGAGETAVTWMETGPPRETQDAGVYNLDYYGAVALARRDGTGTLVREVVPGGESEVRDPSLAVAAGELLVAFAGERGARLARAPYAQAFAPLVAPSAGDRAWSAEVAAGPAGDATVFLEPAGGPPTWETSARPAGGPLEPPQDIGPCLVRLWRDAAVGPDGTAAAVYVQGTTTGSGGEGSVMALSTDRAADAPGPRRCSGNTGTPAVDAPPPPPAPEPTPVAPAGPPAPPASTPPPQAAAPVRLVSLRTRLHRRSLRLRVQTRAPGTLHLRVELRLGGKHRLRPAPRTFALLGAGLRDLDVPLTRVATRRLRAALASGRRVRAIVRGNARTAFAPDQAIGVTLPLARQKR